MARISNDWSLSGPIDSFAREAVIVLIRDILDLDILVPTIVTDYNLDPDIRNGYYMHQNPSGDCIFLNMHMILQLKDEDDMKTVVTYGLIHEIIHMHQEFNSLYKTSRNYYTMIEDTADRYAIKIVRDNLQLINSKLNFQFNEVFLKGIERQLTVPMDINPMEFDRHIYFCKTIAGVIVNKLNLNFDYIFNLLKGAHILTVSFFNRNLFNIDLHSGLIEELDYLINRIYDSDFKMIHTQFSNSTFEDPIKRLHFTLC